MLVFDPNDATTTVELPAIADGTHLLTVTTSDGAGEIDLVVARATGDR